MDESELVERARNGDREAFSCLVKKYEAKVFQLAYGLTRNRQAADDLAQEAFIKAYTGLPKFESRSAFGTWLYRITVNHAKDYLRRSKARKEVSLDDLSPAVLADNDGPEREARLRAREKTRELVLRMIGLLPEKYANILSLRDLQGRSYEEIAEVLNISPGTVDSRLHRARKLLRKRLEPSLRPQGGSHELQES
jgi:RNA polymerase sigma-70 factor (ECF subfamily)